MEVGHHHLHHVQRSQMLSMVAEDTIVEKMLLLVVVDTAVMERLLMMVVDTMAVVASIHLLTLGCKASLTLGRTLRMRMLVGGTKKTSSSKLSLLEPS